jgi:hypothetical protein
MYLEWEMNVFMQQCIESYRIELNLNSFSNQTISFPTETEFVSHIGAHVSSIHWLFKEKLPKLFLIVNLDNKNEIYFKSIQQVIRW